MTRLITATVILLIFAGASYGVHEVLTNWYSVSNLPKQGEKGCEYMNPHSYKDGGCESWRSKYKDYPTDKRAAYPGAKTFLAWTTDADHLTMFIHTGSLRAIAVIWIIFIYGGVYHWNRWKKWAFGIGLWLLLAGFQSIWFHLAKIILLQ